MKYFDKTFFKFVMSFVFIISFSLIIIMAARLYEEGSKTQTANVIYSSVDKK